MGLSGEIVFSPVEKVVQAVAISYSADANFLILAQNHCSQIPV